MNIFPVIQLRNFCNFKATDWFHDFFFQELANLVIFFLMTEWGFHNFFLPTDCQISWYFNPTDYLILRGFPLINCWNSQGFLIHGWSKNFMIFVFSCHCLSNFEIFSQSIDKISDIFLWSISRFLIITNLLGEKDCWVFFMDVFSWSGDRQTFEVV